MARDIITQGAKLYDPANPYANRDPRFYSNIFYNNSSANRDNNKANPCTRSNAGKTETHSEKMLHSRFYIRWAHLILNFAEAANEIGGPDYAIDALSAKEAMRYLRTRRTYDGSELYAGGDPYLEEVAASGQDKFREFVRNERRIETCFGGMRFFDLRRWSKAGNTDKLNQPVYKAKITKNTEGFVCNRYTHFQEPHTRRRKRMARQKSGSLPLNLFLPIAGEKQYGMATHCFFPSYALSGRISGRI